MTSMDMTRPGYPAIAQFLLLAAAVATIPAIFTNFPVVYSWLVIEDSWGEMASFFAFGIAGVLFLTSFRRLRSKYFNGWLLLLGLGALFMAGEEISWGQRLIGLPTPDLLREFNHQGETNLHNFSESALHSVYAAGTAGIAVLGVFVPLFARTKGIVGQIINRFGIPIPPLSHLPLYLAPACLWFLTTYPRRDEIVELIVGFALLGLALNEFANTRGRGENKHVASPLAFALAIIFCFSSGIALAQVSTTAEIRNAALLHMGKVRFPNNGFFQQADEIFNYLDGIGYSDRTVKTTIARSEILRELGRSRESAAMLEQAIADARTLLARQPTDTVAMIDLANIQAELERPALARLYAHSALLVLDHQLNSTEATDDDRVQETWTANIWSSPREEKIARLMFRMGDAHAAYGNAQDALVQYEAAKEISRWQTTRVAIDRKIAVLHDAEDNT